MNVGFGCLASFSGQLQHSDLELEKLREHKSFKTFTDAQFQVEHKYSFRTIKDRRWETI